MEYFNNTKSVLSKFTKMVYGRFGYYATFHDIKKTESNHEELIKVVERNKYSKVIVFKNYVLFPIEQFGVVHGFVKIENGVTLNQSQLKQVEELSDLLVKTMVISEKNKRIQLIIEDIIEKGLESDPNYFFYDNKKVNKLKIFKTNLPTLILASTHLSAKQLATKLHENYMNKFLVTADESNISYFRNSKSIMKFKNTTVIIPEVADLEKQQQLAFEIFLRTYKAKGPNVVACTIFNPIDLIEKHIVRREFLNILSSNRVLNPEDECRFEDKSVLTKYLLSSNINTRKVCLWPGI